MADPASVDRLTGVDAIEHLDFVPVCHVRMVLRSPDERIIDSRPECGKPADWIATCTRCASTAQVCSSCRASSLARPTAFCNRCRTRAPAALLFTYVPIGGA